MVFMMLYKDVRVFEVNCGYDFNMFFVKKNIFMVRVLDMFFDISK